MITDPVLVIDETALRVFLGAGAKERRRMVAAVETMRQSLHEPPEATLYDATGRVLRVGWAQGYLVIHWYDGPVNELRIVDIQRVRV